MKQWTIEELYELWRSRGYGKKATMQMAEADYKEMNRKKSCRENHIII